VFYHLSRRYPALLLTGLLVLLSAPDFAHGDDTRRDPLTAESVGQIAGSGNLSPAILLADLEQHHAQPAATTPAATEGLAERDHLLGDWGGVRSTLEQQGVDIDAVLTLDAMTNLRGGNSRGGALLGNVDVTFAVDTARAGWWENGTFFLYLLGDFNAGGPLTAKVGDLQGTSNIEADQAVKIYEAWYEHRFFDDRFSVLAGLHDLNSEFDVLEYAATFINSSFGIAPDISQVGPSIFPTTALALRLKAQPTSGSYLLAALYDGEPGDPELPRRRSLSLSSNDGIFTALEAGLSQGEPGEADYFKLGVGGWVHTTEVEDFTGQSHDRNHGLYLIVEKTLFTAGEDGEGLGAFLQLGFADPQRNQIGRYWGAGLNYTGLIPGRSHDVTGLAVASARNGGHFRHYMATTGMTPMEHAETVIEATYLAEVLPWLTVQPDVQYIIHPGTDPALDNALVAGARLEILF
jgi:porin